MSKEEFLREMKNDSQFRLTVKSVLKLEVIHKQYYHITELAALTGLTPLALKGRRKRGLLKMFNDGKDILISKKEVERFLNKLNSNL